MSKKIRELELQIEKIQESQKKFADECKRKIKSLNEQIAQERKKEIAKSEKQLLDMVRDMYGEINEDTISRFKNVIRSVAPEEKNE